ncbi:MAG: tetratricopeptide repeat protein [Chroococcidiopsidaceae cyanobacterium CP_BM_RX_35]|nr:tetratricopeptide repeat protein [Chroococcidiopsidaceae cyanobacterium CP_BM_RX_35]
MQLAIDDQKKLPDAIAAYNKAIQLDPNYALAPALGRNWNNDSAESSFHSGLRL